MYVVCINPVAPNAGLASQSLNTAHFFMPLVLSLKSTWTFRNCNSPPRIMDRPFHPLHLGDQQIRSGPLRTAKVTGTGLERNRDSPQHIAKTIYCWLLSTHREAPKFCARTSRPTEYWPVYGTRKLHYNNPTSTQTHTLTYVYTSTPRHTEPYKRHTHVQTHTHTHVIYRFIANIIYNMNTWIRACCGAYPQPYPVHGERARVSTFTHEIV